MFACVCYSVNGGSALHSAGFTSPKTKNTGFPRHWPTAMPYWWAPVRVAWGQRSYPLLIIPLSLTERVFFLSSRPLLKRKRLIAGYSKVQTAVHGCHCSRDMAVRMRDVMARPWVSVSAFSSPEPVASWSRGWETRGSGSSRYRMSENFWHPVEHVQKLQISLLMLMLTTTK